MADFGPTVPIQTSPMDLVIAGERREAEYEWFRYSKIAFPFLLLILGITVALIGLTFQQGDVTLKRIRPGVPRDVEFNPKDQSTENGIPLGNRGLRIAAFIIAYVAIVLIVLVIYIRPAAKIRKALYLFLAILLIVAGVLAWIAFGVDADNVRDATKCNSRDYGNIHPNNGRSPCQSAWSMAVATTAFDAGLGFFAILTGLVLIYAAMKSVRKVPAGVVDAPVEYGVSRTLRQILLLLLFFTFAAAVLLTVFTIVLHSGRDSYESTEAWNIRAFDALKAGWPLKNTRLRLAACGLIIITILLNLIPFRARVIAYIFGFLLLVGSVIVLIAFAIDVRAVASAKQLVCPTNFACSYHKYVATIILDILVCFLIVVYVLYEFVFRLAYDATHASRIVY
jgi:hypothetical protein